MPSILSRLKVGLWSHVSFAQTLYVEPGLCLCDCPGLVMPSFVSTKAEMICSGILPIDQMRDHVPAVSLISFLTNLLKPSCSTQTAKTSAAVECYTHIDKTNQKTISVQALTVPLHMSKYTPACTRRHLRHQYHPTTRGRGP